jgi:hypothetical protein
MVQFLGVEKEDGRVDIPVLWYDERDSFTKTNRRIFETKQEDSKNELFYMEAVLGMERLKLEREKANDKEQS